MGTRKQNFMCSKSLTGEEEIRLKEEMLKWFAFLQ